jgi:enoyl-CoA hydratase/carnithine racemase
MSELTRLERRNPEIAVLTLDRAERRNALSTALRDEISDRLDALAADPELKVLVVTGEGTVFCAGFDLKEFDQAAREPSLADALWASSDRYHHRVATFPMVTIAALNGPAIAGGFDLAVLCDLRIASTTTTFSHPEYAFGDVVYGPLRDIVGGGLARELCLTGRVLDAEEALAAGLVSAVVEPEAVLAQSLELAERVAVAPRANLMRTKAKAVTRSGLVSGTGTLDL